MAKIYSKRGNTTAEEKRYIKELEKFASANPDEEIKPAKNFSQLKKLYEKYCTEEVEFEESELTDDDKKLDEILNSQDDAQHENSNSQEDEYESSSDTKNDFIDPFNKEEPIIRDHVLSESFSKDQNQTNSTQTTFGEPSNFKDSFDIPQSENGSSSGKNDAQQKEKAQKSEPVNPAWNEMDASKKRKSTKRFSKYIVEFVCLCAEKGFIWYSDKNIDTNVAIIKEEFDIRIMVSLDAHQQVTIIQFFELQKLEAAQLAKINEDDRSELIDALAMWMMEKGFAPSAVQELAIVVLSIFGKQALLLFAHVSKTNSIVSQLRGERQENPTEDQKHEDVKEEPVKQPEPQPEQKTEKKQRRNKRTEETEGDYSKMKEIGEATKE